MCVCGLFVCVFFFFAPLVKIRGETSDLAASLQDPVCEEEDDEEGTLVFKTVGTV